MSTQARFSPEQYAQSFNRCDEYLLTMRGASDILSALLGMGCLSQQMHFGPEPELRAFYGDKFETLLSRATSFRFLSIA